MIEFMKQTAEQAGAIAAADLLQLKSAAIHSKKTALDLVTDTDRKVEKFIIDQIKQIHPECGVYGEETGKSGMDREYCFIIDPIDGTASFVHHLPNWSVSIGLFHKNEPVAGVIFQPSTGDMYYAEKGKGAYLNGKRIHVSSHTELAECIVATGFSCLRAQWKEENNLKFFSRVAPLVTDTRKYGSAALDCCYVARGATDAFWEMYLQPYDIAAGLVILKEAGGTVTDLKGGTDYPDHGFMASNGKIHSKMLSFFSDYQHLCR